MSLWGIKKYQKDKNKKEILKSEQNLFINKSDSIKGLDAKDYFDLTNLKIQKILYFLYGYYYGIAKNKAVFKNKKIVQEINFIAWPYGPIIEEIYHFWKKFENVHRIFSDNNELEKAEASMGKKFNKTEINWIKKILDYLFDFSSWILVELSHKTEPWETAVKNKEYGSKIESSKIEKFFSDNYKVYENKFD